MCIVIVVELPAIFFNKIMTYKMFSVNYKLVQIIADLAIIINKKIKTWHESYLFISYILKEVFYQKKGVHM